MARNPTALRSRLRGAPLLLCDSLRGTARLGRPVARAVGACAPSRRSRTYPLTASLLAAFVTGKQAHSEYGADRTYTGETYAAFAAGQQRAQAERPEGLMPPSALRRSMSSRVAGMGAMEESTPAKLKRKVSWAGNTVRHRRRAPRHAFWACMLRPIASSFPSPAWRRNCVGPRRRCRATWGSPQSCPSCVAYRADAAAAPRTTSRPEARWPRWPQAPPWTPWQPQTPPRCTTSSRLRA